jgi:NADP-dependent 3-hydroxy acid dehydrogenase YdfG
LAHEAIPIHLSQQTGTFGGGTGIGLATAIAFAEAGADSISIIGRRLDKLQAGAASINAASKALNTRVFYQAADLLDAEQVKSAFKAIADEVGKIDILVSNAGVLPPLGRVVGYNTDALVRGFEGNVLGALNAVQTFMSLAGPNPTIRTVTRSWPTN